MMAAARSQGTGQAVGGEAGRGKGIKCLTGTEPQVCKMKRVLEMDAGHSCATMGMHSTPMDCALKNSKDGMLCIFYHNYKCLKIK